jgi:hypothetical protein
MCISFLFWYYKDILESGLGVIQTGDITSEILSQEKSHAAHQVKIKFCYPVNHYFRNVWLVFLIFLLLLEGHNKI